MSQNKTFKQLNVDYIPDKGRKICDFDDNQFDSFYTRSLLKYRNARIQANLKPKL